jgi:hypothetical protein
MKPLNMLLTCTLAVTSGFAHADFTYQETTQITGGSMVAMMKMAATFSKTARQAGEPTVSTVMVKGNRMIRSSKDRSEIIDLDAGTMTIIDNVKKQYTTMTFEQMRQQMEAAMAKAKAQQAKQPQAPPPSNDAQNVDVKFTVKVRNTDVTRDVSGLTAKESIMTMTMDATDKTSGQTGSFAITNDMYLAPDIPGYEEVREFYKRYAKKMGSAMSGAVNSQMMAMMQQPAAGKGMADMVEEMSKLKGIPVLQIMRMGTTADGTPLPAASEAPLPGPPPPTAGDLAKQGMMNSIPFGLGKKKKQDDPPPAANNAQPTAAVLVESTIQTTAFSKAPIDPGQFNPPAGYKLVEAKQLD